MKRVALILTFAFVLSSIVFAEDNTNIIEVNSDKEAQEVQEFYDNFFKKLQEEYNNIPDEEIGSETIVTGIQTVVDKEAWTETIEHPQEIHEETVITDQIDHNGNPEYSHRSETEMRRWYDSESGLYNAPSGTYRRETPEDYKNRTGYDWNGRHNLGFIKVQEETKTIVDKEAWTENIEHAAETHEATITEEKSLRIDDPQVSGPDIVIIKKQEEPIEIEWPVIREETQPSVEDKVSNPNPVAETQETAIETEASNTSMDADNQIIYKHSSSGGGGGLGGISSYKEPVTEVAAEVIEINEDPIFEVSEEKINKNPASVVSNNRRKITTEDVSIVPEFLFNIAEWFN